MKLAEMDELMKPKPLGFRIGYEIREGGFIFSHIVPDHNEKPFPDFETARDYAVKMAASLPPQYVNIHVIDAYTFKPIGKYEDKERTLRRYP